MMLDFLKKIKNKLGNNDNKGLSSNRYDNSVIIDTYNQKKNDLGLTSNIRPNYELAKKVFLDFNDFNLNNIESINVMYLKFIPKSLLPYPKNYIKCAYYIYLEYLEKENNSKFYNSLQEVGMSLFYDYPDWDQYQENLKHKAMHDDVVFKDINSREVFKKLFGSYQISKEEYSNSPNADDVSDEKIVHDFGVLPEIEADIGFLANK